MNTIQIIVIVSTILLCLWAAYKASRRKLTLSDLANIVTIYGVAIGVALIFQYSPQMVQVAPVPKLVIHSVTAEEELCDYSNTNAWFRKTGMPAALCKGQISNIGNALSYGQGLEFTSGTALADVEPYRLFSVYLFSDSTPFHGHPQLHWGEAVSGTEYLYKDGPRYRLRLPPIRPNESVTFMVGLRTWTEALRTDREREAMASLISTGLDIKLIPAPCLSSEESVSARYKKPNWVLSDSYHVDYTQRNGEQDESTVPGKAAPSASSPVR